MNQPGAGWRLQDGHRYQVVTAFTDADFILHTPGEAWLLQGHGFIPAEDGLWMMVSVDGGAARRLRLRWLPGEGGEIIDRLSDHLRHLGPGVAVAPPRRRRNFGPWAPLAAAVLTPVWIAMLIAGLLFAVGSAGYVNTPAKEHAFQFLGALLPAGGMLWGLLAMLRGQMRGAGRWLAMLVGLAGCGGWCAAFWLGWIR